MNINEPIQKGISQNTIDDIIDKTQKVVVKEFADFLISQMGDREYMGVKYKQGVFSENEIYEMVNEFLRGLENEN